MKAKDVLDILGITRVTLSTYVKNGVIKAFKTQTGRYEYDSDSVYAFIGQQKKKTIEKRYNVIYCRCSNPPRQYLDAQEKRVIDYCTSKGIEITKTFKDIKSGMNFDRKEFNDLLVEIIQSKIDLLVIENKDRLCRFGFDLLNKLCQFYGTTIVVANEISEKNFEQELTEDLISIIHYFSMKSYSHRRKLHKIQKELEDQTNEESE